MLLVLLFFTIPYVVAETPEATLDQTSVPQQPQAGSWATMASMPTARTQLGVAVVDGKIYAIGGTTQTQTDFPRTTDVGTTEMYDPTTDSWTTKAAMPVPMSDFAITAFQGKIYCFQDYSGVLEIYDPSLDTWTNKTTPAVVEEAQANVADDKIYLTGSLHDMQNGNFCMAYDPKTNTMTAKASIQLSDKQSINAVPPNQDLFSTPYADPRCFWSGRGASVGVSSGEIFWVGIMKSGTFVYNAGSDSWRHCTGPQPSYLRPYAITATTGKWAPQQLYLFNEDESANLNRLIFTYNPESDQWAECTRLPTERAWYGVATVDDRLYVIGGETSRGTIWYDGLWLKVNTSNLTECYTPADYGTSGSLLSVLLPQNGTAAPKNSTLDISVNESATQTTNNSNGQDNLPLQDNSALNQFAEGEQNSPITDEEGSENLDASTPTYPSVDTELLPFIIIVAVSVLAAVCVAVVLVYSKKRKQAQTSLSPL